MVTPRPGIAQQVDLTALAHTYAGVRTINGVAGDLRVTAAPGRRARIRITNTDNAPMVVWTNAPYRVLAVDGTDLHRPTDVSDRSLTLTAGARADLQVTVPSDGQRSAHPAVEGDRGDRRPERDRRRAPPQPPAEDRPAGLRVTGSDRLRPGELRPSLRLRPIGRRLGFVRGRPGMWWSINCRLYPNVPMFVVRDGEVVTMSLVNNSGEVHPMHLHGHRLLVLARDGRPTPAARGGSTRSTSGRGRATTSRSSRTTPASGWITATT